MPSPNHRGLDASIGLGSHVTPLLTLPTGAAVWLDDSPAYDLAQGLVNLMHGGPGARHHPWADRAREAYSAAEWERLRRWFSGTSTIGAAYLALVPLLPEDGAAEALPEAIERMPLGDFLRVAITAGYVNPDAPLTSEALLAVTQTPAVARAYLDRYLRASGRQRALLLQICTQPEAARAELAALLRLHLTRLYPRQADEMAEARGRAVERVRALARSRPAVVEGWLRIIADPAGFAPLILAPMGTWQKSLSSYLHESHQPLFDGTSYEPLLVMIGAERVLATETAAEPAPPGAAEPVERWAGFFAVLADPTRLRLLRLLARRPQYGQELALALGISAPTISHHVDALHKAGIISIERREHRTYLALRRDGLAAMLADAAQYLTDEAIRGEDLS